MTGLCRAAVLLLVCAGWWRGAYVAAAEAGRIDFNRDIRPILSNNCLICHGPDAGQRQAGLRLDQRESAVAELPSGSRAIVPGDVLHSELLARVTHPEEDLRMPPAETGKKLSPQEIDRLRRWIAEGASYAPHWAYVKPQRPELPDVQAEAQKHAGWPQNGIDHFILDRLRREGLAPSPPADRYALARRVALDLTGLPLPPEEVEEFVHDRDPLAYEKLVDRLLNDRSYGEHWARKWLDLARYADSAGYADDPPREIWGYRDWVIRAINENMPFDQFTIEQLAGDLLENPTEDQLIATAFHRNTLTNNEGGTNDEEFRNVAVVDRVNTTMAVWMGTTMACAQCHSHKYDPISQEEYFRFFAIFNTTADADRRDESPRIEVYTPEQLRQQAQWQAEIARLESDLHTPTAELTAAQQRWEQQFAAEPAWEPLAAVSAVSRSGVALKTLDDGVVSAAEAGQSDVYTVDLPLDALALLGDGKPLTAVRLETLPDGSLPGGGAGFGGGNFVITRIAASLVPEGNTAPPGRWVRIELPGENRILSLAEVQVFAGDENVARQGEANQSSTAFDGPARLAIDGNTDGNYFAAKSTTHTESQANPWWEVDLKSARPVDRVVVWNRTDNGNGARLANFKLIVLDDRRQTVFERTVAEAPNPSVEMPASAARPIPLAAAYADYAQEGFSAAQVLDGNNPKNQGGWAVGGQIDRRHALTLVAKEPVPIAKAHHLRLVIEQLSPHTNHTLGRFRVSASTDPRAGAWATLPAEILALLRVPAAQRSGPQQETLQKYFLAEVAQELAPQRQRLAELKKQLAELKPATTVPIIRELPEGRVTRIQYRGNFLDTGPEVRPGVPAVFHPLPEGEPVTRLALARWLVDENNPLTARVVANRYWEAIFGRGLVLTSEEFGSQGELPSHPELLDWLATELIRLGWDRKAFLKLLVTSATYRQTSAVTGELLQRDPDNVLLARGPRVRLSAEAIRDQALAVAGLLSRKMYGPPVKPPQPALGVNAAFGSGIDWQPSPGEDKYRRGIYTTWRRSNPYPSMTTFDAPNREVCTVRRARTNTPLQALVTLNDPVFFEAAQGLARRMDAAGGEAAEKLRYGFRLCLARPPRPEEWQPLLELYEEARQHFAANPDKARSVATDPIGPVPPGRDVADLAAWTVIGNVLLNLDEMFMKR